LQNEIPRARTGTALISLNKILLARTAATSVVQSLVVKALVLVLTLGCGMITARALGPAGRGAQSAIVLWPYLVSGLAGLGISPALTYHTSRSRHSEGGFLFAAVILTAAAGAIGAAVGSFVVPFYLTRYSPDVIRSAQVILLFSPAILLGNVFRANLEARGLFAPSNASRLWPTLFTLLGLAVLWLLHALTPFTAGLTLFVPLVVQTVWLGCDLAERFSFNLHSLIPDSRTLLSYGLRTYGTDVFFTLSSQVDQAVIIVFLSPASLGLYTVALAASRTLNVLQISLNMVLLPKASGLEFDKALALVGRMVRISNLVTFAGALVSLAIIPVVLPLFYGGAFTAAAPITRVLIGETFLMGAASVLAQAFNSTGRPGTVTLLQAGWIATSIAFLVLLVPRMGLSGAAFALLLSSLVRLVATLFCYPLVLHRPIPRLVPTGGDVGYMMSKIERYRR
jgi:O-antigen/teichoic acid export membrane protein